MALKFQFEWEPSEGVTHPVFAQTWARIEVSIAGKCVTTVHDPRSGGSRTGVYGPAALVAEWIVRNFWFLLGECEPARIFGSSWLRRHSLAAGREGMSLPDLRLFRDEERVVAEWVAADPRAHAPVIFVSSGREELDLPATRVALSEAVELVLDRLRGQSHPDALALRADWDATLSASGADVALCWRAARLGLDAFDPEEVTEELERVLSGPVENLPDLTRDDILDAGVRPAMLHSTVGAVHGLVDGGSNPRLRAGATNLSLPFEPQGTPAYEVGYAAARDLRRRTPSPLGGRLDLPGLLATLGMRDFHEQDASFASADGRHVNGLVGFSAGGAPRLIAAPRSRAAAERFLVARGLFAVAVGAAAKAPRALTAAGTRMQAASRAFAAELLVPAAALRLRLSDGFDDDSLDDLAEEFGVTAPVIQHQIENHRLGASG